ncbi:TadE/TadG family type IV pilus assembly protein [Methylopila sp. Yamaguchi]|uniref:TadE/TadG family type IV pilus assembly protein n=1 Tax=Methylopila sp. Yamaguchi TaxID=1437817 RepID=UPI001FCEC88F|nr:TadE/TadG family type IV pilus assembly protein [Methylopila sp. Yamaguchi]
MSKTFYSLHRFIRSDSGATAPLLGLIGLVLIGCMGIAIDIGRSMIVRTRLYDSLDAAGLAVANRISTVNPTAEATKFVKANFVDNFAGARVTAVTATPNADKSVLALTATATMPTSFMRLFGQDLVTVKATSEVTRKLTGLEVVMVLDNTGSMEVSSSMPALKDAANLLVDQLFGDQTTAKNLYVGLVPFSQAVNIGTSVARTAWVKPSTLLNTTHPYYPSYWTGCVEARTNGLDQTDDPPVLLSSALFSSYYSPDSSQNNWIVKNWLGTSLDIRYLNYQTQRGPGAFCPTPMTGMTNVKADIKTGITAMKAQGSTMINLGAVWGWRMLSPRWRGFWDGLMLTKSLPLDYGTKNMQKAVVLMTDGQNNFGDNNYTAYGYRTEGKLGFTGFDQANAELDKRLLNVCSKMKSAGISVYTVAFNIPAGESAVKKMLESCATMTSYYFDAKDQAALKLSFQKIGDSLSNLRVSK